MIHYQTWQLPYAVNPAFKQRTAYFCMEFGIHQALKIYSGVWDTLREVICAVHLNSNRTLLELEFYGATDIMIRCATIMVLWQFNSRKIIYFLQQTDIQFTMKIDGKDVQVKVYYLPPDVFGSAPMFLMMQIFRKMRRRSENILINFMITIQIRG